MKFARDERGSLRDAVYRAKHKLRGQHFFINENLTHVRQEVLNLLLHERREGILSTVLTRGGEVLFAVRRNDRLIRVRSKEEAINILRQIRFIVPEPTCPVEPGIAPAPDPVTSRAPEQTVGPPTEAGSLIHRESTGAGESLVRPPSGMGGAERPPPGWRGAQAAQLDPPLTARPGSENPSAGGRGGGEAGVTRPGFTAAAERTTGGSGPCGSTARPSELAPPLTGRPAAGQPEDRRSEDSGGGEDGRLEESAATGGLSGPRGAAARPVRLDSPLTEVRDTGRVLSGAGAGGEGMGRGASQDLCRGGGARRTSSVPPPRQRKGMEARADPDEMRHLLACEGTRGREGASSGSHPVVPSIQLGGPKGPGTRRDVAQKSTTNDIRTFFK